ncbi:MAG: hypothetical protein M3N56_16640 [Actinomycetota bacterium]|nr:hypothetical protein [Actinomycetota bacterium]
MSSALFTGRVPKASFRRIDALLAREPKRVEREMKGALRRWGQDWHGQVTGRFGVLESSLANRTGRLRGSLKNHPLQGSSLGDLKLRLTGGGPEVPHARIQEYGGVIKPKRSRFLAYPIADAVTETGATKGTFAAGARAFIEAHKGETFFQRTKTARAEGLLLFWNKPGRKAPLLVFKLARQVEIPGPNAPTKKRSSRLAFFDTWAALSNERKRDLQKIARGAGRG